MAARICPYVGLADDPETSLAFPSELNCCQWADPVEPVSLDHQQGFCLSRRFSLCPMLQERDHQPLHPALRLGRTQDWGARRRNVSIMAILGLLVILFIAFKYLGASSSSLVPESTNQSTLVTAVAPIPTLITPSPVQPTPETGLLPSVITALPTLPVETIEPTPTAALFPGTGSSTPLPMSPTLTPVACGPFDGWVLYTVRANDTLFGLSLIFEVTVAQLQQANCLGESVSIQAGQQIYVPFFLPPNPTVQPTSISTQTQTPAQPTPSPTVPPPASPTSLPPTETQEPPTATPITYATPTPVPPLPTPASSPTAGETD